MKTQEIEISQIITDGGTQSRAEISEETYVEYAERMDVGDSFPPVILYFDGSKYYLADGFHRLNAMMYRDKETITAEVRRGTRIDAVMFALRANEQHGLRRTNADKRHCVTLALGEFAEFSDRQIAEMCGVGHQLVANVRGLKEEAFQLDDSPSCQKRIGADGKARSLPQSRAESVEQLPLGSTAQDNTGSAPSVSDQPASLVGSAQTDVSGEDGDDGRKKDDQTGAHGLASGGDSLGAGRLSSHRPAVDSPTNHQTAENAQEEILTTLKLYWRRADNTRRMEFLRWVNGPVSREVAAGAQR